MIVVDCEPVLVAAVRPGPVSVQLCTSAEVQVIVEALPERTRTGLAPMVVVGLRTVTVVWAEPEPPGPEHET